MKFDGIKIVDSFQTKLFVAPTKQNLEKLYKVADAIDDNASLVVKIPMTHSGMITRNAGFYQPVKMKLGGKSFTDGFEKPVQIGHGSKGFFSSSDTEPEVIGRVKQANYIDISDPVFKSDDKLQKLFKQHLSKDKEEQLAGAIGMAQHIDKKYMKDGLPKRGFEGLGFLEGILNIPDREAAQKIIDGRYNTVSISVGSNAAFCSSCSQNLVHDGMCEHRRGEMVDGNRSLIILDELRYSHLAIVNEPADTLAANFQLVNSVTNDAFEVEAMKDFLAIDQIEIAAKCFMFYSLDNIQPLDTDQDINLVKISDAIGGITLAMGTKDNKNTDPIIDNKDENNTNKGDPTGTPAPEGSGKIEDIKVNPLQIYLDMLKDKLECSQEDLEIAAYLFSLADSDEYSQEAKDILGIKEKFNKEEVDSYITKYKEFMITMISFDELTAEDNYKFFEELVTEDAKLSPEKRKELPKASFCGPNRSFPVPDCKHVSAARRLIGRAKASPDTKSKILACVNRKDKSLGCSKKTADAVIVDTNVNPCDNTVECQSLTQLTDDQLKVSFDNLKKELSARELYDNCSGATEFKAQISILDSQLEAAYEELDNISEQFSQNSDSYKNLLIKQLVNLKILNGEEITDLEVATEEFGSRSVDSLQDSIKDLSQSVDMNLIAKKIYNGISREPTEPVANPVLQDNTTKPVVSGPSKKTNSDKHRAVYENYDKIMKTYGKKAADSYITKCKHDGLIPS